MSELLYYCAPLCAAISGLCAPFVNPRGKPVLFRLFFAAVILLAGFTTGFGSGAFTVFADRLAALGTALCVLLLGRNEDTPFAVSAAALCACGLMLLARADGGITVFSAFALIAVSSGALLCCGQKNDLGIRTVNQYLSGAGISAATLLLGIAFLYSQTGPTFSAGAQDSKLFDAGALFLFSGFIFLAGLFPFLTRNINCSQSGSEGTGAFITAVAAASALLCAPRLFNGTLLANNGDLNMVFAVLGAVGMTAANTAALFQKDLRKLAACAASANAGWVICLMAVPYTGGTPAAMFFTAALLAPQIGLFAFSQAAGRLCGTSEIGKLKTLWARSPAAGAAGILFLITLAGIPLTAGFAVKLLAVKCLWTEAFFKWAAVVCAANALITAVYCGKVIMALLASADDKESEINDKIEADTAAALAVSALLTVGVSIFAGPLYETVAGLGR